MGKAYTVYAVGMINVMTPAEMTKYQNENPNVVILPFDLDEALPLTGPRPGLARDTPVRNGPTTDAGSRARVILLERYGSVCQLCTREFPPDKLTLDHIIPRARGGMNDIRNLQLACALCNTQKAAMLPAEFAAYQREQAEIRALIGVVF
jgi:hypothetical protein